MSELKPLPDLTYETPVQPARELGEPGRLANIALSKLLVDQSYQRPIDVSGKKNIRRIAENFRWTRFSPLIVSPRAGGMYAVIDGQHRAAAAKLHGGIKELPCLVLKCDPQGEADAFSTINGIVTRMQTQYLFRARVAAGDKAAVASAEAAKAAGVRLMPYPVPSDQLKPGETLAVSTVEKCLAMYGRDILVSALRLITETGDNAGLVKADIIEAFARVLWSNPNWFKARVRLHEIVSRKTVRSLYADANRRNGEKGGGLRQNFVDAISEVLRDEIGVGGETPKHTITGAAKYEKKKGVLPANFKQANAARTDTAKQKAIIEAARRPSSAPASAAPKPSQASVQCASERELIEQHLKTKGVRRFDTADTADPALLVDWLVRVCKRSAKRVTGMGGSRTPYEVDGRRCTPEEFFKIVNVERAKRKLEPITLARAA